MAQARLLHVRAYEEPYVVSEVAKEDWMQSLQKAKDKICRGIATAFGVQIAEGEDPCDAIKRIERDRFVEKLAEPAVAGWRAFFGITPEHPAYATSIKMLAKLSAAHGYYAQRVSDALKTYFVDRVAASVDKWAERMITIRFVGDPPHSPLGPAPLIAYALTNGRVPRDYMPPHAVIEGQFGDYIVPRFKQYVRPLIIASLVQTGVIARYLLIAGLTDVAQQYLSTFAQDFGALLQRLAAENITIQFAAGYEDVDWSREPMIYFDVVVQSGGS